MEQLLKVGEIANTHGIRGEVKVYPTTDDVKRFKTLKNCILDTEKEKIPLEVTGCKFFKQFAILKFKQYDNINQVERYRHCGIYVTREDAVKLEKDEYYIADLIGITVLDESGEQLGKLKDVIETGANDVYLVARTDGKELLIPALKECILSVDVEQQIMKVHLLEGLLDL